MKAHILACVLTLALLCVTCTAPVLPEREAPRLTVLLIVDQMRADFLERFAPVFDAGLARLLDEGVVFEEAHHAHAYTWTAAGHATLTTGVHPSRHGVIGNHWWDRDERRSVGAVEDRNAQVIGFPNLPGASPKRLRGTALGDWLVQLVPRARVWSVAIKDRSAIAAGGRRPTGAFWYDLLNGRFVTSDYYFDDEPRWVADFHADKPIDRYRQDWDLLAETTQSRADLFAGELSPTQFPHRFSDGQAFYTEVVGTPFGDRFTMEFVTALVEAEALGADDEPDLLILGLSAADYIGHAYGPRSVEIEDYYRRLDRMLGEFIDALDTHAGSGNWLLALTSDHGVLQLPEQSRIDGTDAERLPWASLADPVQRSLRAASTGEGLAADAVSLQWDNGWVFDAGPDISPETLIRLRRAVADDLKADPRIEDVFTWDELAEQAPLGRPFEDAFRHSFDPQRSADLMPRFREFDLPLATNYGTNHGAPYRHDTHVPLIFLNPGTPAVRIAEPCATVDVAPTLAACLGVVPPVPVDGKVLDGVCTSSRSPGSDPGSDLREARGQTSGLTPSLTKPGVRPQV